MRRLAVLVALTACKASLGDGASDGSVVDGTNESDAPRPDAMANLGPWGAPTAIPITPMDDDDPTATGDLLELYFNRANDIYVATRASTTDAWSAATAVTELNSLLTETTPEVSYDGLTMYLASARAGTAGGNDIWISTRAARTAPWGAPVRVAELSSTAAEGAAAMTADGLLITIDSDRAGATGLDLYVAQRGSPTATWGVPALVTELNSAQSEGNPMITSDKLTIYFSSNRTGNGELFVATRGSTSAAFETPQQIMELSAMGNESDPWISPDGRTMYFASDRDGTQRLWQTTR